MLVRIGSVLFCLLALALRSPGFLSSAGRYLQFVVLAPFVGVAGLAAVGRGRPYTGGCIRRRIISTFQDFILTEADECFGNYIWSIDG